MVIFTLNHLFSLIAHTDMAESIRKIKFSIRVLSSGGDNSRGTILGTGLSIT